MYDVRVLSRGTFGLRHDAKIISSALSSAGIVPCAYFPRGRNLDLLFQRLILLISSSLDTEKKAKANIFVEQIMSGWLSQAHFNFFVPNQEWCRPETLALLSHIDHVLCKTRYAEGIFSTLGYEASYIGFSSEDRFLYGVHKDFGKVLHVAGRSEQKGTTVISRVWARHPEWPELTIVTRNRHLVECGIESRNIRVITDVLSSRELAKMQNEFGVHLCLSEAEGFGHYICEAMSCGAIVVATNAPPINELVTSERGILVDYKETRTQSLGTNFYADPESLEKAMERLLSMSFDEKMGLSEAAREWFLLNERDFKHRFAHVIQGVFKKPSKH